MCGFGVQELCGDENNQRALRGRCAEAEAKIYTQGCIPKIQTLIENNLYTVVGVAIGVAVSQVCQLSNETKN
jgi:hypothetical protein